MRQFCPDILIPKAGIISGELFVTKHLSSALVLFWKIEVLLDDFVLGNYPVFDSLIIVTPFTLPYISSEATYDPNVELLRSWKQLSRKKFAFENSKVDNVGVIYYSILDKSIDEGAEDTGFSNQYDNSFTIYTIEFGEVVNMTMPAKILMKIEFDSFNVHDPPFANEWYSDPFEFKCQLKIGDVNFTDLNIKIEDFSDALCLAKNALDLEDYQAKYEIREFPSSYQQIQTYTEYIFEPREY